MGLTNPRGFVIVDKHQRNPKYPDIFAIGVCVAIPTHGSDAGPLRRAQDRLHDRIHGHGNSHEHRAAAEGQATRTSGHLECGLPRRLRRLWRGLRCPAADPAAQRELVLLRKWVHGAKVVAFEKYFLHKIRRGTSETFYEKLALDVLGIGKLKETTRS